MLLTLSSTFTFLLLIFTVRKTVAQFRTLCLLLVEPFWTLGTSATDLQALWSGCRGAGPLQELCELHIHAQSYLLMTLFTFEFRVDQELDWDTENIRYSKNSLKCWKTTVTQGVSDCDTQPGPCPPHFPQREYQKSDVDFLHQEFHRPREWNLRPTGL